MRQPEIAIFVLIGALVIGVLAWHAAFGAELNVSVSHPWSLGQFYVVTLTAFMLSGCLYALSASKDIEVGARAALVSMVGALGIGWGSILTTAFSR